MPSLNNTAIAAVLADKGNKVFLYYQDIVGIREAFSDDGISWPINESPVATDCMDATSIAAYEVEKDGAFDQKPTNSDLPTGIRNLPESTTRLAGVAFAGSDTQSVYLKVDPQEKLINIRRHGSEPWREMKRWPISGEPTPQSGSGWQVCRDIAIVSRFGLQNIISWQNRSGVQYVVEYKDGTYKHNTQLPSVMAQTPICTRYVDRRWLVRVFVDGDNIVSELGLTFDKVAIDSDNDRKNVASYMPGTYFDIIKAPS
ncbi:hypothetical protein BDV23DRAFT_189654 [Aspergillus alliaceus]|uniref:Fucose-specific lectin n=1 Tax=Petromyces alliaceus TaxID=209559 RepID=A0A5N7BQ76_PETAA|nr:hypothetical protein BDV23DRAFT_189654 [Aspergillus alliaceus]